MKTAISLSDEVFQSAEQLAKRLGKSRSELYALAISDYLDRNNGSLVKKALDDVYSKNKSEVDSPLKSMQLGSVDREEW